jgi:hypothetical protein
MGNPHEQGLPIWPATSEDKVVQIMNIDVNAQAQPEQNRECFLLLKQANGK